MQISTLSKMGLYEFTSYIRQLQGLNKAFWVYIDAKDTTIHDPEIRELVNTASDLVEAEGTLLAQAEAVADRFVAALERYDCTKETEETA